MPKSITIEINNSILQVQNEDSKNKNNKEKSKISVSLPCEIIFEEEEFNSILSYIENNKNFKSIKIQFPGEIDLKTILSKDELIAEKISNLKITIREKEKRYSTSLMEYI